MPVTDFSADRGNSSIASELIDTEDDHGNNENYFVDEQTMLKHEEYMHQIALEEQSMFEDSTVLQLRG